MSVPMFGEHTAAAQPGRPVHRVTSYFGRAARTQGGPLTRRISEIYAHHGAQTTATFAGSTGFGVRRTLETDTLENSSLNLPVVMTAIDVPERAAAIAGDLQGEQVEGMLTLERACNLRGSLSAQRVTHEAAHLRLADRVGRHVKVTIYARESDRTSDGRPAATAIVDELRAASVAGATVLDAVDGTLCGKAVAARGLFRRGEGLKAIVSVGDADAVSTALERIGTLMPSPTTVVERAHILRCDGHRVADRLPVAGDTVEGLTTWTKLSIYGSLVDRHDGEPVHLAIVQAAREIGGTGATTLTGVWGYHGDHEPHGAERFRLRRRVPVVTTIVERAEIIDRVLDAVEDATRESGLVTVELVPARQVLSRPGHDRGGLRLAPHR